jgi:transglutaminase-like putative cysteine protease
MNKSLVYGLLLSILMVTTPHTDHLPLWVSSLCATLLAWRSYLAYSGNPLPARWLLMSITLACLAGIAIDFHTLFGREVGVTLLALLASLKSMELKSKRDAMALIYLCCFIIITNFFYSQSLITALYMLVTLLVIASTWVHLHAPRSAFKAHLKIATVLLLQAIPLTVILFVLFPRIQGPLWGLPQDAYASSGLDDTMSPGSMGRLSLSDAVAFRVKYQGAPPRRDQMYWRGPVLWKFDGRTWTPGRSLRGIAPDFGETGQTIEYNVTLEAHNKNWLFALDVPDKISVPARITDDFQLLSTAPVNSRLRYDARSQRMYHANLEESPQQLRRALQLPDNLDPRARQLAASWRQGGDMQVVNRALTYFNRQEFHYTLDPPPLGIDGIDDFLFTTRRGFCEHYASSFVFLMRAAGIPARVVTGYQGGEYNAAGDYYIVRQSDAHAWAEVWLKGAGWLRVDPTAAVAPERVERGLSAALPDNTALPFMTRNPPRWLRNLSLNLDAMSYRWNQWVIGYDTERQFATLARLGMDALDWRQMALYLATTMGLAIALFALFMLRHLIRREPDKTQTAWLKLCRRLALAGLPRAPYEGPQEYAMRIAAIRPDLTDAIRDLASRYSALRYGAHQDDNAQREFIRLAAKFKPKRNAIIRPA